MRAKPAILLAAAITLISVGVFFRREPETAITGRGEFLRRAPEFHGETQKVWGSIPPTFAVLPIRSVDDPEFLRRLADSDPVSAASEAARLGEGPVRVDAIKAVAIAWANQDLAGAIEWGRQLPRGTDRQIALTSIGFEAVRSNPLTALTVAVELNANSERDELIRHAAGEWAVTAPDPAAEWAKQIEDGPLRSRTLAAIAIAWAERDPRAAATLAIEELEPGRLQEDAVVSIVQRWAQQEPADAAEWISNFDEGELRAAAVHNLVKLWTDQDPAGVGEWLQALVPGSMRTVAIGAYEEQIGPAF